jgi:hypothetical protein
MTAGLPGMGIGAFFYFMLVICMPLHELYLTARGRSSLQRWKSVGFYWAISIAIVVSVLVECLLITYSLGWLQDTNSLAGRWLQYTMGGRDIVLSGYSQFALITSVLFLSGVMTFTYLMNLACRWGYIRYATALPATALEHVNRGQAA